MPVCSNLTTVWIAKDAAENIREEAVGKVPFETGGCLLGYWSVAFEEAVIEECIGPGPRAKHSEKGFAPDSKWQEAAIADIYNKSGRLRTYLGDWHSHMESLLSLSWKDQRTLSRIANYPDARAPHPLMAVVTAPSCELAIWKVEKRARFYFLSTLSRCVIKEFEH
jgi:integrative and conjugative element protein (TIGR02256 family)